MKNIKNSYINIKNNFYYEYLEKIIYNLKKIKTKNKTKNNKPKVSIYTPTKNRCDILIDRAVKGVLGQTYSNFEYIIVGDYCSDNTKEKLSKIKDTRLKFYDLKDHGIEYENLEDLKKIWCRGGAIPSNFALKKCSGDWIARCDDDEEWTNNFLEEVINFASKNDYEFVSAGSIYSQEGNDKTLTKLEKLEDHFLFDKYFDSDVYYDGILENPKIGAPSTWVMKNYIKLFKFNVDCWRKDYNQVCDCDLINRFARCGVRCGYLDKSLVYQLPRPGNNATGLLGALNDYDSLKNK